MGRDEIGDAFVAVLVERAVVNTGSREDADLQLDFRRSFRAALRSTALGRGRRVAGAACAKPEDHDQDQEHAENAKCFVFHFLLLINNRFTVCHNKSF